jgi:hypothetical protein
MLLFLIFHNMIRKGHLDVDTNQQTRKMKQETSFGSISENPVLI